MRLVTVGFCETKVPGNTKVVLQNSLNSYAFSIIHFSMSRDFNESSFEIAIQAQAYYE